MARYIDADKLKEAFSTDTQHLSTFDPSLYDLIVLDIDEAPTADVEEVVRCKDCKHKEKETNKWCKFWNKFCAYDDNYCGYGDRSDT